MLKEINLENVPEKITTLLQYNLSSLIKLENKELKEKIYISICKVAILSELPNKYQICTLEIDNKKINKGLIYIQFEDKKTLEKTSIYKIEFEKPLLIYEKEKTEMTVKTFKGNEIEPKYLPMEEYMENDSVHLKFRLKADGITMDQVEATISPESAEFSIKPIMGKMEYNPQDLLYFIEEKAAEIREKEMNDLDLEI